MSFFVGIDPSLRSTGFVVMDSKGVVEETGRITSERKGVYRLYELEYQLGELLGGYEPIRGAAIEGYSMGQKNNRQYASGEWGGVARLLFFRFAIPTVQVSPKSLKKFVCLNGNAKKPQMLEAVESRFGFYTPSHDIADAFGLAVMVRMYFNKEEPEHKKQREALLGVQSIVWARRRRKG